MGTGKPFRYKGFQVKDSILGEETAKAVAEDNGVHPELLREEDLALPYADVRVHALKYQFYSRESGRICMYEFREDYGGDLNVCALSSPGDFADLRDLYLAYMQYRHRETMETGQEEQGPEGEPEFRDMREKVHWWVRKYQPGLSGNAVLLDQTKDRVKTIPYPGPEDVDRIFDTYHIVSIDITEHTKTVIIDCWLDG